MGLLFEFNDELKTANGEPISGHLLTGDLSKETFGRNLPIRLSRVFYDLQTRQPVTDPILVQSTIYCKNRPQESYVPSPTVVLDSDFRHDFRAVAKIFKIELKTDSLCYLSDLAGLVESAGERV